MKRSLSFKVLSDGSVWIMSNWTGEIVKPWEIRKVFGLISDFRRIAIEDAMKA